MQKIILHLFMVLHGINSEDISVIVQGAVEKETEKCLKSVRKNLPDAEIVLSTWKDCNMSNLDFDKLVQSDDPGNLGWHFYGGNNIVPVNYNRQLVSTKSGIEQASRKFVLKLRSDFFLENTDSLSFYEKYSERDSKLSFFKNKVLIPSVYTRMFFSGSAYPCPFCFSDFLFFGLKEDIFDYFNSNQLQKEEMCNWNFKYPDRKPDRLEMGRYMPEQFLAVNWAKRHNLEFEFYDCSDWSFDILELSNKVLFNNFIVFDASKHGIKTNKHNLKELEHQFGLVNERVFNTEYEKLFIEKRSGFEMNRLIQYWKPKKKNFIKKLIRKIARSCL